MHSVYQNAPASAPVSASGGDGYRSLLEEVLQISHDWAEGACAHGLQRDAVMHLWSLTQELLESNVPAPPVALTQLRALLCGNCRALNAAQGQCTGRSLDQCRLLNGAGT